MTTKPSPLVLVLGHSFVRRLETFVVLSPLPCVSPNFQLPVSSPVHFYGVGGRTVTQLRQLDLAVVARCRPTLLILDIGSNDLCNPFCNIHDLRNNIGCNLKEELNLVKKKIYSELVLKKEGNIYEPHKFREFCISAGANKLLI